MKLQQRQEWILEYLRKRNTLSNYYRVDILDSDFVWDYIEHTGAVHNVQMFGAPKCPQLGRDLSAMYFIAGTLDRASVGIGDGLSGQGFPKWVWSYSTR